VTRLKCNEFIVVKYNVVGGLQFMYFFYKVWQIYVINPNKDNNERYKKKTVVYISKRGQINIFVKNMQFDIFISVRVW
jgi:hypothetical protein